MWGMRKCIVLTLIWLMSRWPQCNHNNMGPSPFFSVIDLFSTQNSLHFDLCSFCLFFSSFNLSVFFFLFKCVCNTRLARYELVARVWNFVILRYRSVYLWVLLSFCILCLGVLFMIQSDEGRKTKTPKTAQKHDKIKV